MPEPFKSQAPSADKLASVVSEAVGARLRRARTEAGLSQSQVARALGYAPSLISAFESGARRLKVDDLVRLCALFEKSADYFLAPMEPVLAPRVGVKLRAKLAAVPQQSLVDAVGSFLDYAELELSRSATLPDLGADERDPEVAARRVLEDAGVSEPPVDLDRVTRALGIPVIAWSFPDSLSALLADTEAGGYVIGVNRWHHPNRQRFSIAHECGHAVLGHAADFYLEFTDVNPLGEHAPFDGAHERAANQFAAALLMDAQWLHADFRAGVRDAATLAAKYRVSEEAMSFRLLNLRLA
jgi:Zn-dependent peptidase ImmA (M78 family)/transcriptional regulator with XRE-family HTH domain